MSLPVDDPDAATRMYHHRPEMVSTDRGDGPAVVFSHGTLMDRSMFDPQLDALAGDYRTLAYDHRARTEHGHAPYDLADLVDDCRTFLDAKQVDSCVLAGMSMGGFMALRFALTYPDVLDGIVLIDSQAAPHADADQDEYEGMIEQTRAAGEVPADLAELVSHLLFGETSVETRQPRVQTWIDRWLTYPGEAIYHEVNSWLDRPGVADRLDEIDVPALVLHGEEDASIDPELGRATADGLPDGRFELIPEAGHSSNLENPEPTNTALRQFLDTVY